MGRNRLITSVLIAGLWVACVYPTERSSELSVEMDAIPVLLDGDVIQVKARLLDANGDVVDASPLTFTSSLATVAAIDPEEGFLLATGVGPALITVRSKGFVSAKPAEQLIKVQALVTIDSMRPRVRFYGSTVRIYGSGLNPESIFLVSLGDEQDLVAATDESWTPADPNFPNRFGVLSVWVAPPTPRLARALVLAPAGNAQSPDAIAVIRRDIYEPNDTIPWDLGGIEAFHNPALAFEGRSRDDSLPADWYRFTQTVRGDRTFFVQSNQTTTESYRILLTDSLEWRSDLSNWIIGPDSWLLGPGFQACHGIPFELPFQPGAFFRVAIEDLAVGTYDLLLGYSFPAGYELRISTSYESQRVPDEAEENDVCQSAFPLGGRDTLQLTIDNPHEADWFSFSVSTVSTGVFQAEVIGTVGGFLDPDLDVYVFRRFATDSIALLGLSLPGEDTAPRASVGLVPGEYFVLVTDFAGVPTRYRLVTTIVANAAAAVDEPISTYRATDPIPLIPMPGTRRP